MMWCVESKHGTDTFWHVVSGPYKFKADAIEARISKAQWSRQAGFYSAVYRVSEVPTKTQKEEPEHWKVVLEATKYVASDYAKCLLELRQRIESLEGKK